MKLYEKGAYQHITSRVEGLGFEKELISHTFLTFPVIGERGSLYIALLNETYKIYKFDLFIITIKINKLLIYM